MNHWRLAAVFLGVVSLAVRADVRLPALLSDHMVLQQGMETPIWGWADAGENVSVTCGQAKVSATPDDKGKWMVKLPAMKAEGQGGVEITIAGKNTIVLKDVLVGEVWICSGQSNMWWPVWITTTGKEDIASADLPKMRLFTVAGKSTPEAQKDCKGKWELSTPTTAKDFSAVGFVFGRELHRRLDVPVGLIATDYSGTPAEAWTRWGVMENDPQLAAITDRYNDAVKTLPEETKKYEAKMEVWNKKVAEAKKAGKPAPNPWGTPQPPMGPGNAGAPGGLYNAMIAPLIPYGIRGAIWYQGEANVGRAGQYRHLLGAMIKNWREDWGEGDFPFLLVQIAPFQYGKPEESAAAELRDAQRLVLGDVPNTGMAVTLDVGEPKNVHPVNKAWVGQRLALWALAKTYGKCDLVYSGPLYKAMSVEGEKIKVTFDHVGGGLVSRDGKPLSDFQIAGEDKKFVPAEATIEGETVIVHAEKVKEPVAVRFGWTNVAQPNLANKEGLPASSFTTEN